MATITGTSGNDTLLGQTFADSISGGGGNDFIAGLPITGFNANGTFSYGNDTIVTGAGNSTIIAGGSSQITTGAGNSAIILGFNGSTTGNESVTLGNGNNIVLAVTGNNTITGTGNGVDFLLGGSGNDSIVANASDLAVFVAGTGNQTLDATKAFASSIVGGAGNDVLIGNSTGASTINASTGKSIVSTSGNNNQVTISNNTVFATGGVSSTGNKLFISDVVTQISQLTLKNDGTNENALGVGPQISGFEQVDASATKNAILLKDSGAMTNSAGKAIGAVMIGGQGADTLTGNAGVNDTMTAGAGNTVINGLGGTDVITNGAGNDTVQFATAAAFQAATISGGTGSNIADLQDGGAAVALTAANFANASGFTGIQIDGTSTDTLTVTDAMLNTFLKSGATFTLAINDKALAANAIDLSGLTTARTINVTLGSGVSAAGVKTSGASGVTTNFLTSSGGKILVGTTSNDNFVGSSANDLFQFTAGTLNASGNDTVTGGGGTDTIDFTAEPGVALTSTFFTKATGISVLEFDGGLVASDALTLTDTLISALTPAGKLSIVEASGQTVNLGGAALTTTSLTLGLTPGSATTGTYVLATASSVTLADTSTAGGGTAQTLNITATAGSDTIIGGAGTENITYGSTSAQTLTDAGGANQAITIAGGALSLTGGAGTESITGGDGNLTIVAGAGNETISIAAPAAADSYIFSGGASGSTITFTDSATTTGLTISSAGLNSGESITINVSSLTTAGGTFVLGGTKDSFSGGGTTAAGNETIQIAGAGQDTITLLTSGTRTTAADQINVGGSATWNDTISNFIDARDHFDFTSGAISHGTTTITTQVTNSAIVTVGGAGAEFATNPNSVIFNIQASVGSKVSTSTVATFLNSVGAEANFSPNNDHVLIFANNGTDSALFYYNPTSQSTVASSDLTLVATFKGSIATLTTTGDVYLH